MVELSENELFHINAGGVITSVSLIGTGPAGIAGAGILIASTIESASDFYDTYYRK